MKDISNLHQQVQAHCDCFATTDPLKEMSEVPQNDDTREAAIKWLALAALHGVNANAEKITITSQTDGDVTVQAKYRKAQLPSPGNRIGSQIIQTLRQIIHIYDKKGKLPLSLGIRDSSVDLQVKVKSDAQSEQVTIRFP